MEDNFIPEFMKQAEQTKPVEELSDDELDNVSGGGGCEEMVPVPVDPNHYCNEYYCIWCNEKFGPGSHYCWRHVNHNIIHKCSTCSKSDHNESGELVCFTAGGYH